MPITPALGLGGLPCIDVHNAHGSSRIYLHGAHVTSWVPAGGSEVLWLSARSWFATGKPIRGGIPICFPWFGAHASDATKPAHGFARLTPWTLLRQSDGADASEVVLGLSDSPASRAQWPHAFRAELSLRLGRELTVALAVTNTDATALTYEAALHTYFAVKDIERCSVDGCSGAAYADRAGGGNVPRQDDQPSIRFAAETDRLYLNRTGPHMIRDEVSGRCIRVAKDGAPSTVVWNPWVAKAAKMADYGDREWPGMVCVEAANVASDAVTLAPGATHRSATVLSLA